MATVRDVYKLVQDFVATVKTNRLLIKFHPLDD